MYVKFYYYFVCIVLLSFLCNFLSFYHACRVTMFSTIELTKFYGESSDLYDQWNYLYCFIQAKKIYNRPTVQLFAKDPDYIFECFCYSSLSSSVHLFKP